MQPQLRPVCSHDGPALVAAHRASRALHRGWVSPCLDQAGFEIWFSRVIRGEVVSLMATARVDDRQEVIVGVCNFSQIVLGNFCSAYLGYYACEPAAGRGLMAPVLRMATRYGFAQLGLHRIEANIQPENQRSRALVQRVGFRREGYSPRYLKIDGQWRDHERWALLADDPA
jgi:ribosomal-protein-alanine N-acetyltransferase